jgi:hypothetical protein
LSTANGRTSLTIGVDLGGRRIIKKLPGVSETRSPTLTVQTYNATGYTLSMQSDGPLRSATNSVPATTSGTIGTPPGSAAGPWTGTGFGFTIATGTGLETGWGSGTNWAAVPTTPALIHASGAAFTPNQDNSSTTRIDYKWAVSSSQPPDTYTTTITYTATATP